MVDLRPYFAFYCVRLYHHWQMFSIKRNLGKWLLLAAGVVVTFDLLNPWLKKYDYGAGYPLLALLVMIVGALAVWHWRSEARRAVWLEVLVVIGLVLAAFALGSSEFWGIGFSDYLAMSLALVGYYFLATAKDLPRIGHLVAVVGGVAAVLGFVFYFSFDEVRMFGPFFNKDSHAHTWPNAFALFLLMVWPFVLTLERRVVRVILLAVVLAALVLTFSRGALIAFGGQAVLMLILWRGKAAWKELIAVVVLVGLLIVGANELRARNFAVESIEEKVEFAADEGDQSKDDRLVFWRGAYDLALEKPILGHGPFSFRQAYAPHQEELLQSADHPHNFFLKLAAEYGVLFMLVWVVLLLELLWRFWRGEKDSEAKVLFVAAAGGLAHNLIDYNLNFLANLTLLILCLGYLRAKFPMKGFGRGLAVKVLAILLGLLAFYDSSMQAVALIEPRAEKFLLYPREETRSEELYNLGLASEAIALNPLNEFKYYVLDLQKGGDFERAIPLLEEYFVKVKFNENFTAYSDNVEYAAMLIDEIVERDASYDWLLDRKAEMWEDARHARKFKQL